MSGAQKSERDPRLDWFRGLAMCIILIAHAPANPWALWIPARFGFSDATEIFVFCSGLASALAFGATFLRRGWLLGAARVVHRVWQVYWAHVGVFLFTAALLAMIDLHGLGVGEKRYVTQPYVLSFLEDAMIGLPALLTLTYTPGLFDILPMYLVILGMIPVVMAAHRVGGGAAAAGLVAALWLMANLAGHAQGAGDDPAWLASLGAPFTALNLPASPWEDHLTWFFNPFAWQAVFFLGFSFGMGWLAPPPVSQRLILSAAAVVLATFPFAWFRLHQGFYLPPESPLADWFAAGREATAPLWWKTWQGPLRLLHFVALAYLAWVAAGPLGRRLSQPIGWRAPEASRRRAAALAAAGVALVTGPWAWIPAFGDGAPLPPFLPAAPYWIIAWCSLLHAAALAALAWNLAPEARVRFLLGPGWLWLGRTLRRIGQQSLAVFMASVPLAVLMGLAMDHLGRTNLTVALVNLAGMTALYGVARATGWFKGQPWRSRAAPSATDPAPSDPAPARATPRYPEPLAPAAASPSARTPAERPHAL